MHFNRISLEQVFIAGIICLFLVTSGCVQMKTLSLYDGEEAVPKPQKPKEIELLVEPRIYDEDATDVWGLEKGDCMEGNVTEEVAYSGKESIYISWNRDEEGCKFAGIGIGWDRYAGKDLSELMEYAAIQLYVRSKEGRMFGLPIVLTLEDYSGGMGFAYTGNKYFERTAIDEEWQRVVVPLSAFDLEKENLDPTNIKQLQLELQQSGSVYLDDIKLVFYEPEPQTPWMEEEVLPNPIAMPIQILDDDFINNNSWGLISDDCQTIKLTDKESSEGNKSVHAKWDTKDGTCKLTAFGASWNKWFPVDITPIRKTGAIQFDIKMAAGSSTQLPIRVGFEDYERAKKDAALKSAFIEGSQFTDQWNTVTIPLSEIPEGLDFTRIKQLYFALDDSGEVFIDNIKLIAL